MLETHKSWLINRLPAASRNREANLNTNLEIGARSQAACDSTQTLWQKKMQDLSDKILRQKAIAERNHSRGNSVIYVGFSLFFGFLVISGGIESATRSCIAGVILLVVLAIACAVQKGKAKCPKCGFDWEIKDSECGESISILNWKCCPGCGLKMPTVNRELTEP